MDAQKRFSMVVLELMYRLNLFLKGAESYLSSNFIAYRKWFAFKKSFRLWMKHFTVGCQYFALLARISNMRYDTHYILHLRSEKFFKSELF